MRNLILNCAWESAIEDDLERCARLGGLQGEVAAVETGKFAGDGESDAGAGDAVGELVADAAERMEDGFLLAGRNAWAVVMHRDFEGTPGHAAGDTKVFPIAGVFLDVANEVAKDLLK